MVQTRRNAQAKAAFANEHILKLPTELHMMIFDYLADERKPWLASLATLCKTLLPEVEAVLYSEIEIGTCKYASALCRAISKRRYRAVFVRRLVLSVSGGTTLKKPLNTALPLLTNLTSLELVVDEPSIFDILLHCSFRLHTFIIGGERYAPNLEDILASQPDIERLSFIFIPEHSQDMVQPQLSRPGILPKLQTLTAFASRFPLTFITYPYPLTHLSIMAASHNDIAHVMKLFGSTLVTVCILRLIGEKCTPECYWPASMFRNAHLSKLEHVKVTDLYGPATDLPCEQETMPVPGLQEACPALKTLMWSVDSSIADDLYWPPPGGDGLDGRMMTEYARLLFATLPALATFTVHELGDPMHRDDDDGAVYGEVYRRAEGGEVKGPENEPVELGMWRGLYAQLM
ncbi:hypothetical protein VTO73DRAFT_12065 [Trametes versicolor]